MCRYPIAVTACLLLSGGRFNSLPSAAAPLDKHAEAADSPRAAAATGGTVQAPLGPRILHFPSDRSLGRLLSRPARVEEPVERFEYWLRDSGWEVLGPAQGAVTVPAGCQVFLSVDAPQGWRDLSSLAQLAPDDLYSLRIQGPSGGGLGPGDACVAHVAHLTGLRILNLTNTNITGAGMRHVVALKNLRYLSVPDGMDDQAMVYVGRLSALTGLYFKQNRVTNAGLKHLAKLPSLAELELGGGQINDEGLACLAELPQLRYLLLWGKGFTNAGLGRLRNVKALEILNLGGLEQITDVGLAQLSDVPQVRSISLYRCKNVTNAGLAPLKRLPNLRKLDIAYSQVTDEGLVHLKEIRTLEGLMLPSTGITNQGLQYLSELPRLRELQLRRPPWARSALDKAYYTDEGFRALALCTEMRDLDIDRLGVTDEGVRHLAKLTRLRKLSLRGSSRITDESLRTIAQFHSLEALSISSAHLSISGLKSLNSLANLKSLDLRDIIQDNSGLDWPGLTNLESLIFNLKRVEGTSATEPFQARDIAALGKLIRLKNLQISHSGANDAALRYLTGLKRLETLSLGGDGLTDKGLACLAELPRLRRLSLSGRFTDKALEHLQKLPSLESLRFLSGASFNQAALVQFRRNMPGLVHYSNLRLPAPQVRPSVSPRNQRK